MTSASGVSFCSTILSSMSMSLSLLAFDGRSLEMAVIFTWFLTWSIIVTVDSLVISSFGVAVSVPLILTVLGSVLPGFGVLILCSGTFVGGGRNSVLPGFGVLILCSGTFVGGSRNPVDCYLRSGTKWLVDHEGPLQGPSLLHSIVIFSLQLVSSV